MSGTDDARAGFESVNNGGKPPEPAAEPPAQAAAPEPVTEAPEPAAAAPEPLETPTPSAPELTPADALTPEQLEAVAKGEDNPLRGYTNDQVNGLLARLADVDKLEKSLSAAHGKIGEINRTVSELRTAPKTVETPPAAGAPAAGAPAPADLPDVDPDFAQTYPEFAAELQKIANRGQKAGLSQEEVDARVAAKTAELTGSLREEIKAELKAEQAAQAEEDALTDAHSDWRQVVQGNAFKVWREMQTPDVRKIIEETNSAAELAEVLTTFKEFSGVPAPAAAPTPARAARRMAAAVTPSGTAHRTPMAPAPGDDARAGFASVMGGGR